LGLANHVAVGELGLVEVDSNTVAEAFGGLALPVLDALLARFLVAFTVDVGLFNSVATATGGGLLDATVFGVADGNRGGGVPELSGECPDEHVRGRDVGIIFGVEVGVDVVEDRLGLEFVNKSVTVSHGIALFLHSEGNNEARVYSKLSFFATVGSAVTVSVTEHDAGVVHGGSSDHGADVVGDNKTVGKYIVGSGCGAERFRHGFLELGFVILEFSFEYGGVIGGKVCTAVYVENVRVGAAVFVCNVTVVAFAVSHGPSGGNTSFEGGVVGSAIKGGSVVEAFVGREGSGVVASVARTVLHGQGGNIDVSLGRVGRAVEA